MKKISVIFAALVIGAILMISFSTPVSGRQAVIVKDPVDRFIDGITMYKPISYKNLTIYPVKAPGHRDGEKIVTLDEALEDEMLVIKEVSEGGSVNELSVWNNSKKYVFIMAGEILKGSKQDRILQKDVLLPPNSGKVSVKVFCVEHGRWAYESDKFYSEKKAANIGVRNTAQASKAQGAVWDDVASTNRSVGASSETGTLSAAQESEEVAVKLDKYKDYTMDIPEKHPSANGVIVLINDKVLVADIFSSRDAFEKLWPKLEDSYILEAVRRENDDVDSEIKSASGFMEMIQAAKKNYDLYEGTGKSIEITSDDVTGTGVLFNGEPVHLGVFPKIETPESQIQEPQIYRNYQNNAPISPELNQVPNQQQQVQEPVQQQTD